MKICSRNQFKTHQMKLSSCSIFSCCRMKIRIFSLIPHFFSFKAYFLLSQAHQQSLHLQKFRIFFLYFDFLLTNYYYLYLSHNFNWYRFEIDWQNLFLKICLNTNFKLMIDFHVLMIFKIMVSLKYCFDHKQPMIIFC